MKKIVSIISLLVIAITCLFAGSVTAVFAEDNLVSQNVKSATLSQGDELDARVEELNFDDLYLSSLTEFDKANAKDSMFGGFIETTKVRIEKSFEIALDVLVLESTSADSVLGFGLRNVALNDKVGLIQSGGYQILFGKNVRLDGIETTSKSTVSIVKNGALSGGTSTVDKYAVFNLPTWLSFDKDAQVNLKIGSVRIIEPSKQMDTKGYYVYVTATVGENSAKIAEMYDYCDNSENIGSAFTGVVDGSGKYSIYNKETDNVITTETAESYDLLQLDEGTTSYYNVVNKGLFGRARTATANSLEVSMRIIVDTPATSWHMFDIGLKNCYNGEFDHFNGGYGFKIGRNKSVEGGNSDDTMAIIRNGLYDGKDYHVNAMRIAKMPTDFKTDMFTKGSIFKMTYGIKRIISGDQVLGYYAYIKYNDRLVMDFYDYFDYEANLDYFGDVFTGGIEAQGAYYITTTGTADKEFEQINEYDLSKLIPVSAEGVTYTADSASNYTEKVIGRYLTKENSVGVKTKVKFIGKPAIDLSLSALDDGEKADSIRFNIDVKNQTFRVYTVAMKDQDFDSGELDLSALDITVNENVEYLLEYGVVRYKYEGASEYNRAQVYLKIDGVTLYRYNVDYIGALVLGYYAGGRVIGSENESATLIPTEDNQLVVTVTASTLKEKFFVDEKNAIVYQSTAPFGLVDVEYQIINGEQNVSINKYGAVTGLKEGTATVKVILKTQYGVYESNQITLNVSPKASAPSNLSEYRDFTVLWITLGVVAILGVASAIVVVCIKKKK